MSRTRFVANVRRIAPLAWPVFIGQIAVLAFSTVDTVLVARASQLDLAALAIGGATYVSVFVGLMGVVLAIGPIAGQLFGAGHRVAAGRQFHQALWLALMVSVPGCALLLFPDPFLALARASPEVEAKVRDYLGALAFALPPALLFTAFRGFNTAVSRPRIVMALQLGALALKVPLSALLVFGLPAWQVPALGAFGCGIATAIVLTLQLAAAWQVVRRDPFYDAFGLRTRLAALDRKSLFALARLGLPMGGSIMIEVTGFTFMALFIARLGVTPVAAHQLAANIATLLFMMPLAIGNATGVLVAQRVGASDLADARRLGWHGTAFALLVAGAMGVAIYLLREPILRLYTADAAVIAAALTLAAGVVLFHLADAGQAVLGFVLRAWRIATAPLVIYAFAQWGVGLAGGYVLAFDIGGFTPQPLLGAPGFWAAATLGLVLSGLGQYAFLVWLYRRQGAR